jgi:hypothetical protein
MGRQDIINHIESEIDRDSNGEQEEFNDPALCQHCGVQIISSDDTAPAKKDDYVVHRVPTHGESKMNTVFYCSPSCFNEAMSELFSPSDAGRP